MEYVLVDTDVISYIFKEDTRGDFYEHYLENKLGIVSFMTIAELDSWVNIHNWGDRKRNELESFLSNYTVIESDRELCRSWAAVHFQARRSGRKIETADAWIAATALLYQIPLVSHNRKHFDWIKGLQLISES